MMYNAFLNNIYILSKKKDDPRFLFSFGPLGSLIMFINLLRLNKKKRRKASNEILYENYNDRKSAFGVQI